MKGSWSTCLSDCFEPAKSLLLEGDLIRNVLPRILPRRRVLGGLKFSHDPWPEPHVRINISQCTARSFDQDPNLNSHAVIDLSRSCAALSPSRGLSNESNRWRLRWHPSALSMAIKEDRNRSEWRMRQLTYVVHKIVFPFWRQRYFSHTIQHSGCLCCSIQWRGRPSQYKEDGTLAIKPDNCLREQYVRVCKKWNPASLCTTAIVLNRNP